MFKWDRGHLFDNDVALMLYQACTEEPLAHVLQVFAAVDTKPRYTCFAILATCFLLDKEALTVSAKLMSLGRISLYASTIFS